MVTTISSAVKNRRKFLRIPSSCSVTIQKILFSAKADSEFVGQAQNISEGGLMLTAARDYHLDELVKISISLPAWAKAVSVPTQDPTTEFVPFMSAICQIVRTRRLSEGGYEIAGRFVDVFEDDLAALKAFIESESKRLGVTE